MTFEMINTLITSVGFPITCVLGLGWFVYRSYNDIVTRASAREDKLYELIGNQNAQLQEFAATNAEFLQVLDDMKADITEIKNKIEN